jgi:ABC-2 type transport system permease protein
LHIVHNFTRQEAFDWWPVASTYLGILLVGGLFVAVGCFGSAVTSSQITAAMVAFALGVSLFVLSFLKFSLGAQAGWVSRLVTHFSLIEHMEDFARGIVDTRHVVFYLSLTVLFLFLTLKVVESRRWK